LAGDRWFVQRFDYLATAARRGATGGRVLAGWQRQANGWLQQEIALAESTQTGLAGAPDELEDNVPIAEPLAQFRQSITALLPSIPTLPERPR
jgi:hypothetical protein